MNILILSTSERGIAPYRLYKALGNSSISVKMLVRDKLTDNPDVISVNISGFQKKINRLRFIWERIDIWLRNGFSRESLFQVSIANTGTDISQLPEVLSADVIHLHWINQGFLSLKDIKKLVQSGKPVVWTMHDMWPCTAICHHARECDHYQRECGNCFYLKHPASHDLSYRIFKSKLKAGFSQITFVACSRWLENCAGKSALLKGARLLSIPNPLDIALYCPRDKEQSRKYFGFSSDKYFLLFGAANVSNPRKGVEYFFNALRILAQAYPDLNNKIELIFFGSSELLLPQDILYKANFVGYLSDENAIVSLYNAANLFIIPSLEDNLPNTIMESMACGTPVVGFEVGGIPEMIDHMDNGYVANYMDSEDLMRGIYWTLFEADSKKISINARKKVEREYSEEKIAGSYTDLYKAILKK